VFAPASAAGAAGTPLVLAFRGVSERFVALPGAVAPPVPGEATGEPSVGSGVDAPAGVAGILIVFCVLSDISCCHLP